MGSEYLNPILFALPLLSFIVGCGLAVTAWRRKLSVKVGGVLSATAWLAILAFFYITEEWSLTIFGACFGLLAPVAFSIAFQSHRSFKARGSFAILVFAVLALLVAMPMVGVCTYLAFLDIRMNESETDQVLPARIGLQLRGEWKRLDYEQFGVSVLMPEGTVRVTNEISQPGIPSDQIQLIYLAPLHDGESIVLSFTVVQFPPDRDYSQTDLILEAGRTGIVKKFGGRLLSAEQLELESFPGHELRIESADGHTLTVIRAFIVEDRLYQAMARVPVWVEDRAFIESFMNSLRLSP
jgi:hypothetical protein